MKSHIHKLALVWASVLGALLIIELALQIYYYRWNNNLSVPFLLFAHTNPSEDKLRDLVQPSQFSGIIYELKPNLRTNFYYQSFVTNSQGLIGTKEFPKTKNAHTVRIAGVGDSVMSSFGVTAKDTYLSVLDELLNNTYQNTPTVEILNFAVPGYNTAIELNVIKQKILPYQPDMIILGYVANDIDLPNFVRTRIKSTSYLAYAIQKIASTFQPNTPSQVLGIETDIHNSPWDETARGFLNNPDKIPQEYAYMVGLENFFKLMQEIADITINRHIPVVVLANYLDRYEIKSKLTTMGFHVFDVWASSEKLMIDQNILYEQAVLDYPGDQHLNNVGHRIWGETLYSYLHSSEFGPEFQKILNKSTSP